MNRSELVERYGISPREAAICGLFAVAFGVVLWIWVHVTAAVVSVAICFGMLVITITDSRRMLVPDAVSLPMIPLGLVASILCLPGTWQDILINHFSAAVLGAATFYALRWLYFRWRGVIGLGLGDVKLAAVAGAWLGLENLPMALLLASCAALIATLLRSWSGMAEPLETRTAVPFGSFIAPAIIIIWTLLLLLP